MGKLKYGHLDPVRDHEEIVKQMVVYTCSFDFVRAIEIALLKTFAIPSIAKILIDSGEFLGRTQKRYDDTDLLLSHFIEKGYSSPEGAQAIQRINRMHARHPITNEQMLYVLATFVVEPILWMQEFGARELSITEKQALFHFWIAVGKRMGIRELFADLETMQTYHESYERQHMLYSENNAKLYHGVLPVVAGMMPFPLSHMIGRLLPAIMSERLTRAFQLEPAGPWLKGLVRNLLILRAKLSELLPRRALYRTRMKHPSYPDGHTIKSLGV